tara:strand:+ start:646 stop:861 length:216 start_codon:yes stop_codon:yes gene_type:complete
MMSWKDILKIEEKSHCATTEKIDDEEPFEKKEVKPDYIDLDGDGNKKESMKQAAKDKKKKSKSRGAFTNEN